MADYESVDSRNGIRETLCESGQRISCFNYFQFTVKREERSRSKRRAFVKRQKISIKSLNGKSTWPSEERAWLSKNCMKLRLKWTQEIGRREIQTSLFKR